MAAIYGACVTVLALEKSLAVNKPKVFVPGSPGLKIALQDYVPAAHVFLATVKIRFGDHENGQIGFRLPNDLIEAEMRPLQMVYIRSIVIIIQNKCRQVKR